jgi:hypothetical protein
MARVSPDATAWPIARPFRDGAHARWRDKADDSACIALGSRLSRRRAFAMGSVYVNFMPEDESTERNRLWRRLPPAVRSNDYDPDNLFRMNQSIRQSTTGANERICESTEPATAVEFR